MSQLTKLMCGIIILTIPTIQYGGYFLLRILSGHMQHLELTAFQKAMFRAGHAHAGVIVILSLVCQILVDHAVLPNALAWVVRIGLPLSAILISGGFFASAGGKDATAPNGMIVILYAGVFLLAASLIILGVGLLR